MATIETEVGWEKAREIYEKIERRVRFKRIDNLMLGMRRGLEMGYYAGIMDMQYLPIKACQSRKRKEDFNNGFIPAYRAGFRIGKEWHNKS